MNPTAIRRNRRLTIDNPMTCKRFFRVVNYVVKITCVDNVAGNYCTAQALLLHGHRSEELQRGRAAGPRHWGASSARPFDRQLLDSGRRGASGPDLPPAIHGLRERR